MTESGPHDGAVEEEAGAEPDPSSERGAGSGGEEELETLRRESAEQRDQMLRLAAELDNVRKRAARELENARKFGMERLAQALIPVYDSLEAGLSAEHQDIDSLLEGQRATLRLLQDALEQAGVERIDPEGEPFDPTRHEAMSLLPSAHAEPDSVVEVVQKGYAIEERLLRPARVIVAKAPDTNGPGA